MYPVERIFDVTLLELGDEVVEPEGLRTALAVAECIYGLLIRLEERLVDKLVYRCDHNCCTALSMIIHCCRQRYKYSRYASASYLSYCQSTSTTYNKIGVLIKLIHVIDKITDSNIK